MVNRIRKTSHSLQRKRLINRQKQKLSGRRHSQFIQDSISNQDDK